MKILITTDNIGGVWTFTLTLARELKKKGIEVHVAVTGTGMTDRQKKELDFTSWSFTACRQEWMDRPWDDLKKAGEWLLMLKNLVRPDLIHLNSYSFGSLPWDVPVVITAHSCIMSWKESVKEADFDDGWLKDYREHVITGLRAADMVVAPGNTMLNSILHFYGPVNAGTVIYNGAEPWNFFPGEKEKYVFCMGRLWDKAKNIRLVLQAAPYINCPVYIAGDTGDMQTGNIPANVHFVGTIPYDEVSLWLSKAYIYALPVRYEPFGYTFLEAALSGCAIITGDIPSAREIWGDAAFFADPSDHHKLAELINRLISDRNLRNSMAEKAMARASNYTSEKMTEEYISVYRELTGKIAGKLLKLQER